MALPKKEVRVLEWIVPGYEGAYTQYTIEHVDNDGQNDPPKGYLYISQVATLDNMSRVLMDPRSPAPKFGSIHNLRKMVEAQVDSRCGGNVPICREITDRDLRKCTDCEHFKFMHGPEKPGCVGDYNNGVGKCPCTHEWPGENGDDNEVLPT